MSNDLMQNVLGRLDSIDDKQGRLAETQAGIKVSLDEHMRRTEAAETSIALLREDVKPLTMHVAVVIGITKVVLFAGAAVALVEGVMHIVGVH